MNPKEQFVGWLAGQNPDYLRMIYREMCCLPDGAGRLSVDDVLMELKVRFQLREHGIVSDASDTMVYPPRVEDDEDEDDHPC